MVFFYFFGCEFDKFVEFVEYLVVEWFEFFWGVCWVKVFKVFFGEVIDVLDFLEEVVVVVNGFLFEWVVFFGWC